jgi:type III pantothenate kinase
MNLILDIGNSLAKCAIYDNNKMRQLIVNPRLTEHAIADMVDKYGIADHSIISCVREDEMLAKHVAMFQKYARNVLVLDHSVKIPIQNKYITPQTLGADRIAAAVGAWTLYPNRNILIINIGTALVYDLIDNNGRFLGGSISLGMRIRFRALNHFTSKLPLCQPSGRPASYGGTTYEAITSGVQNGIRHELQGMQAQYEREFDNLLTIMTGGDAHVFSDVLPNAAIEFDLTLIGLNAILEYQQ